MIPPALENFVRNVTALIIAPLYVFLFAAALLVFVWGAGMFILRADDAKARETGKQHLLWGLIGMFIMVAAFPILAVVTATFCQGHLFCKY